MPAALGESAGAVLLILSRCVIFPGWQRVVLVSCGVGEAPARRGIA